MDNLLQHYGIDWAAMTLTLIAIYMLGNKQRLGFVIMIGGNLCWITLGGLVHSVAMIVANVIFIGMNIRAFMKWAKKNP